MEASTEVMGGADGSGDDDDGIGDKESGEEGMSPWSLPPPGDDDDDDDDDEDEDEDGEENVACSSM